MGCAAGRSRGVRPAQATHQGELQRRLQAGLALWLQLAQRGLQRLGVGAGVQGNAHAAAAASHQSDSAGRGAGQGARVRDHQLALKVPAGAAGKVL